MLGRVGDNKEELRIYCRSRVVYMDKDVSSYAKGSLREWLFKDLNLRSGVVVNKEYDGRIYKFAQRVYEGCDIGLLTYNRKIDNHQDHGKLQSIARLVNLGIGDFYYDGKTYRLNDGEIIEFNCKKYPGLKEYYGERYSLIFWKLK